MVHRWRLITIGMMILIVMPASEESLKEAAAGEDSPASPAQPVHSQVLLEQDGLPQSQLIRLLRVRMEYFHASWCGDCVLTRYYVNATIF
ncbi:hypothetical protein HanXRQr2_Chr10g0428341 [Helianthus annuus]|uniref:Thioredoxin-like fold protein n=1 Tax=Helianthus annuus TaxID=4232 RepID=A0A9K3HVV7_HELAN|nr:hypothetical protein HanXRQr2_Chr10g0428341 [Helianthus annuus]